MGVRAVPEEIIAMILAYVAAPDPYLDSEGVLISPMKDHVVPLACVSSVFRAEVERILYSHIRLNTPKAVVKCFLSITKNGRGMSFANLILMISDQLTSASLAGTGKYVKSLRVALDYDSTTPSRARRGRAIRNPVSHYGFYDDGRALGAFFKLVRAALISMKQLKNYHLTIGHSGRSFIRNSTQGQRELPPENAFAHPWLPIGAPFKLLSFTCSGIALNLPLMRFLRDQPSIIFFDAASLQTKFRLGPRLLPNLRYLSGASPVVRRAVGGRPVEAVNLSTPTHSTPELAAIVSRLKHSSRPIRQIVLPSIRGFNPGPNLAILANNLPDLEHLVLSDPGNGNSLFGGGRSVVRIVES